MKGFDEEKESEGYIYLCVDRLLMCLAQGDTGEFMLACARGGDECSTLAALRVSAVVQR